MLYLVAASVPLILLARWMLRCDPRPVNGVYSLPGTWYPLKYALFRLLMQLRRRQNASSAEVTSGEGAGYGMRSRSRPSDMDKPQDLSPEHPLAVDAVYFNGADRSGIYIVAATARRHNNVVQTILLVRIPDIGLLEFPTLPETNLEATHPGEFAAGGLKLEPVEPMQTWKLTFSGKLRLQSTKEQLDVKFSLEWTSLTKYFDFDTDLHPAVMCDAIAREKWSRQFFDTLKRSHQTHYEQFGEITGSIDIEKHGVRKVKLQGVRDHSYGNKRDWSSFHRYILQYVYVEDGTAVCFGAICIPNLMSRLIVGYVFQPDGSMDAVSSTDFEFYNMGDDGHPPEEFSFNFTAGGTQYTLKGSQVLAPIFYMGTDWDAKIHERMCTFTLNGIPGWGISEWDYRNPLGKASTQQLLL